MGGLHLPLSPPNGKQGNFEIVYSQRLPWPPLPNKLSHRHTALRAAGAPILDLTVSNPTAVLGSYPHGEIARAYGDIGSFAYEPAAAGLPEAREALARVYGVPSHRVFLTASSSEAYSLLFKLLCDPGDEILIPTPSYPLFEYLAALESVSTVPYRLLYDGSWYVDLDDLGSRISPKTKVIVAVSPNNPTGSYLKQPEADALVAIAAEHKLAIISDEVFRDYPLGTTGPASFGSAALSFTLNGLSKLAGMPQMKLGWIIIDGPPGECDSACERLELLLDTYLSVSTPVQKALPRLLEIGAAIRTQLHTRTRLNRAAAKDVLKGSAAHCLHVEAGWSAILQLPRVRSEEAWVLDLLSEAHILLQPGYFFDMRYEAYVVVSLITPPEIFAEGLRRLRKQID